VKAQRQGARIFGRSEGRVKVTEIGKTSIIKNEWKNRIKKAQIVEETGDTSEEVWDKENSRGGRKILTTVKEAKRGG